MERFLVEDELEIDRNFKAITESFLDYLIYLKNKFDLFDKECLTREKRIQFIKLNKEAIFSKLDIYFTKSWEAACTLDSKKFKINRDYYFRTLAPLLELAEINRHIYRKPFGYPGDYIAMNYIYDFNGDDNFLGNTSFEMLINNYTCNLPFSGSNVIRKQFLKEKILCVINSRAEAQILSIGSGPTRELTELLKEGKIKNKANFTCLDFEIKALEFIRGGLETIREENKGMLDIKFLHKSILEIIKYRFQEAKTLKLDLVYVFGIFDYLSDKIASILIKRFYETLNEGGELIICNASSESNSHRAYYEMLGGWNMIYRSRQEMLDWLKDLNLPANIGFVKFTERVDYLFLVIKKPRSF